MLYNNLESFWTFRHPLFNKPVSWLGHFVTSYSKVALVGCTTCTFVLAQSKNKYSEVSIKHGVFLILFEKIFPTTCLIRASTFINFWGILQPSRLFWEKIPITRFFSRLCKEENEISYFDLFGDIGGPKLCTRLVMNKNGLIFQCSARWLCTKA